MSKVILLDNGHGEETPGKRSPDGKFREYAYTRKIAKKVQERLKAEGYDCRLVTPEENDIKLTERCKRVNKICAAEGAGNVVLVSIHNDAAPQKHADGWENARGWSAWAYTSASESSHRLADCLMQAAKAEGLKIRLQYVDKSYWTANYYILRHTACPAILTENLFQNNRDDVEFLTSEKGIEAIVNLHVNGIKKFIA